MAIQFRKATKEQSRLRLSIAGPAGSGKTFTALKVATELSAILGGTIAVIDTERGSASKYSDLFEFDVLNLDEFHPEKYIEAMKAAEKAGYNFLIIDSTTHEWNGKGGILELHESAVQKSRSKNSYTAWAEVTPLHQKFVDAILNSKCHIIASVRSKSDYVQDKNESGKTEIRKVGMASIQREGMDYEYDVMIEMDLNHNGVIMKTRCNALDGKLFKRPGSEFAGILAAWLSDGAEPAPEKKPEPAPEIKQPAPQADAEREQIVADMRQIYLAKGKTETEWQTYQEGLKAKTTASLKAMLANWQRASDAAASKSLIEEINGPISAALREISETGLTDADILDKIIQITQTEGNLSTMEYPTLVEVRDRLKAWFDELKDQLTQTQEVTAEAEPAQEVQTVSV